jgi:hypothetical protein
MNKLSNPARRMKTTKDRPERTMGIDVGDRYSHAASNVEKLLRSMSFSANCLALPCSPRPFCFLLALFQQAVLSCR